jgi:hypothetical protein
MLLAVNFTNFIQSSSKLFLFQAFMENSENSLSETEKFSTVFSCYFSQNPQKPSEHASFINSNLCPFWHPGALNFRAHFAFLRRINPSAALIRILKLPVYDAP